MQRKGKSQLFLLLFTGSLGCPARSWPVLGLPLRYVRFLYKTSSIRVALLSFPLSRISRLSIFRLILILSRSLQRRSFTVRADQPQSFSLTTGQSFLEVPKQ
jgi:hypothetical protein